MNIATFAAINASVIVPAPADLALAGLLLAGWLCMRRDGRREPAAFEGDGSGQSGKKAAQVGRVADVGKQRVNEPVQLQCERTMPRKQRLPQRIQDSSH